MSSETDKLLVQKAVDMAKPEITKLVAKQLTAVKNAAAIRVKIINGTATIAEKADYAEIKADIAAIDQELAAAGSISSAELDSIKADQQKQKLARLAPPANTLSFSKPNDLFEYVLRTQALNPYSRERACDIEFMDLLTVVATKTNTTVDRIKNIIKRINNSIVEN